MLQPIATITNTAGFKGDLKLRPLSRYFEDYISQSNLLIGLSSNDFKKYSLEDIKGHGKKRRFKFEGLTNASEAKKLIGYTIFIKADRNDKITLISKEILGYQIITTDNIIVGQLKDVLWLPSNDVYIVDGIKKEILIPIIPEIVKSINFSKKQVIIEPIDGMLD